MNCEGCGAGLPPDAATCPYCKRTTAVGARQAERVAAVQASQAEWERTRAQQATQQTAKTIEAASKQALIWAAVGFALCCLPIPSVVAFVMALRVKRSARAAGLMAPGTATAALVLSFIPPIVFVVGGIWIAFDQRRVDTRIATLQTKVEKAATASTLEQSTACDLAELSLLEHGYEGDSGLIIKNFSCPGKLVQTGDRAVVDDVRFVRGSGKQPFKGAACFVHGARWAFDQFRASAADCGAPPPVAPSSASARAETTAPATQVAPTAPRPSAASKPRVTKADAGSPARDAGR